ncbi:MAG TPA: hypothetical protein VLA68_00845 [Nitrososphaera sp.]|nr:hypothetical protein [Nitrososphaera sp.]
MAEIKRRRRGIGTVIATLIILIASVMLGASVVLLGGSFFQTNAESEELRLSNTHVWVSPNGTASVAAFVVQNTGGKPVTIEKITIRGQQVPFSSWYYNNTASIATAENVLTELKYDDTLNTINVRGLAPEEQFSRATGAVSLHQGQAMFVYLEKPSGISALDTGLSFTLNVGTGTINAAQIVHVSST